MFDLKNHLTCDIEELLSFTLFHRLPRGEIGVPTNPLDQCFKAVLLIRDWKMNNSLIKEKFDNGPIIELHESVADL
jgi:hypothetical protein